MLKQVVNTPEGTASYPWLNTPDTKFGTPGNYSCNLVLDPSNPEADEFLKKYDAFVEKAKTDCIEQIQEHLDTIPDNPKNKAKRSEFLNMIDDIDACFKNPLAEEYDSEGELTGNMVLTCSSKAEFKDKKTGNTISLKPDAYDATGNVIKEGDVPQVGGGSKLRLKITLSNYFIPANKLCGIKKPNIHAFQIVQLASAGGGGGFGAVDGGYVQEQKVTPSFENEDQESAEY